MKKIGVIVVLFGLSLIKSEIVGLAVMSLLVTVGLLFLFHACVERRD